MSAAPRWGYKGLGAGLGVALVVWLLKVAGFLESFEGFWYDRLVYFNSVWQDRPPRVLMVEVPPGGVLGDPEAISVLERFLDLGASRVVFDFLPPQATARFYRLAQRHTNVFFGRSCVFGRDDPDGLALEPWPSGAIGNVFSWGVACSPPGEGGVYRRQYLHLTLGPLDYLVLPTAVVRPQKVPTTRGPRGDAYRVNFLGPPGRMPKLTLARVLADDLVPGLVKGRTVLVGYDWGMAMPGLHTPVSGDTQLMSLLEYHANALQTLLEGVPIRTLGRWELLGVLIGLGFVSSMLYQRVTAMVAVRLIGEVLLILVIVAVAALGYYRVWIELGALVVLEVLLFLGILLLKALLNSRAINEIRLRSLARLKQRFCPEDFYFSKDYWDYLASMIDQTLDVQRMVFWEREPKGTRLREMKRVNCSSEDILESGRQLGASPFAEAIANKSPVRVFNFFRPSEAPESQYVCPLLFAGEVLGIWVFGIDPNRALAIPQFPVLVGEFSQQIAQLLYHKRKTVPEATWGSTLRQWLAVEKENETYRELSGLTQLLEQQHAVLETLVGGLSTATVVYDLFGRVLSVNDQMTLLLEAEDFRGSRGTVLDLIRLISGWDDTRCRQVIRHALLEKAPVSFPVKLPAHPEQQYLARVHLLESARTARDGPEPFQVKGLVCELIDITPFSYLATLKGLIAGRLGVQLRNDFAAIEMSASLLEMPQVPETERSRLSGLIRQRITQAVQGIEECQKYLEKDVHAYGMECYPLDVMSLFNQVCAQFVSQTEAKRLRWEINQPRLMSYVLASREDLTRLFTAILSLLIQDAAEDTPLTVSVETQPQWVTYHFANRGFGVPDARLQQILTGSEPVTSEDLKVLRTAFSWVHNWGGTLEVVSGVGSGYLVSLTLRQFM